MITSEARTFQAPGTVLLLLYTITAMEIMLIWKLTVIGLTATVMELLQTLAEA